ncbi:MAG: histone-like nucleoid-structuring protein Lsr2, partial [Microbacterium sp.]
RRSRSRGEADAAAIRAWASANGIDVSSRGRVPRSVREQYDNR